MKLMRDGKAHPVGGFASKKQAICSLAADGWTSREIADHLALPIGSVSVTVSRWRKHRARGDVPAERRSVSIHQDALDALEDAALVRQITVADLVRRLIDVIADERLVDAILDDGVLGEQPAAKGRQTNGRANHGAA